MLTFKNHPFMIHKGNGVISVWDDELNSYTEISQEFIEDLYNLSIEAEEARVTGKDLPQGFIYKP